MPHGCAVLYRFYGPACPPCVCGEQRCRGYEYVECEDYRISAFHPGFIYTYYVCGVCHDGHQHQQQPFRFYSSLAMAEQGYADDGQYGCRYQRARGFFSEKGYHYSRDKDRVEEVYSGCRTARYVLIGHGKPHRGGCVENTQHRNFYQYGRFYFEIALQGQPCDSYRCRSESEAVKQQ